MTALATGLLAAADALEGNADELTRLDSLQGDGDLGRTARAIAGAIRAVCDEAGMSDPEVLRAIGAKIAGAAPSSSGTLVASAFLAAAKSQGDENVSRLTQGIRAGIEGMQKRGKAQPGDRTMLDALFPALEVLDADPSNLSAAAAAAERGIEETKTMQAKFGRARFLAKNAAGEPDPGAVMVGKALAAALGAEREQPDLAPHA